GLGGAAPVVAEIRAACAPRSGTTRVILTARRASAGSARPTDLARTQIPSSRFPAPSHACGHSNAPAYASGAWFSNLVNWPRNVSLQVPVGPLRCLPTMISARPLSGDSEL